MELRAFRGFFGLRFHTLILVGLFLAIPAWGAIGIDATVSGNQNTAKKTIATPSFSTASSNELLLAFISSDSVSLPNTTVTGVAGAGLTWVLAVRTNAQSGTAEIWRAFAPSALSKVTVTATLSQSVASSITVMSFTGVDPSGTNGSGAIGATGTGNARPGAPTATLIATRNNSWVFGVGNDWDNAIARTPGTNQTIVHQLLASVGDTYWVQRQNAATPLSGTSVTINDTAPTSDRYNLSIIEVLPAAGGGGSTVSISGAISPASLGTGTVVTLSGTSSATATADGSGNYSFGGLANGSYTVTPAKTGLTFNPANQVVPINGTSVSGVNFTVQTWTISGTTGIGGATVTLSGASSATTTADSSGNYTFSGLINGSYTVTPAKSGSTFTPANQPVTISGANGTANFTATPVPTYSILGTISPSTSGSGTTVTLSGAASATTTADGSGSFTFSGLANGSYAVTPAKSGYTFTPANQAVTINGGNGSATFNATPVVSQLLYPDLQDIIPTSAMSIVQNSSGKMFQYTHDTYNGGPGPLVIQPVYNSASGTYQGTQYIYTHSASGQWTVSQQIPVAGSFIFDSAHGHFHFPFTAYGLYSVAADGTPGTPVAISGKVSFCINDSFIYNSKLANAGAIGNLGSCNVPTSLRGLNIGAVDEYDQTDPGQSISIDGVPDGTYWLRAVVDPDDYLAEGDKTNNETDVELTISGTTLQVLKTVVPVLPAPPSITITSPSNATQISGTVQLTATTLETSGVQFLIDGQPLGSLVPTAPFTMAWDTTTTTNRTHWLAAQTTGPTGRIGTSSVVSVIVSNSSTTPPTVTITSPANGATVSATVTVSANAASSQGIASVSFYVDNSPVGTPVIAPPFMTFWDTETATAGQHVLTAIAIDTTGNTGTSAPVTVTVDNSHPPNLIGKDVTVSVDGQGTMTTSSFSTSTAGDLLVAFVSYDGPSNSPQTATVSGAGLSWSLVKRSNSQAGTAEIWAANSINPLSVVTVTSQAGTGSTNHGSLTVIAFTNASGPGIVGQAGAPSGAPDIFLPGVSAGNWVFAVGNDWDNPIARTPVTGQVLVHQRVDTQVGDTYWVQSTAAPSTANALVDIHDSSPTTDRWDYAAVEIVATRQ